MSQDDTALVVELRKYLSSSPHKQSVPTAGQVEKLKQELNLAARVGQKLLMQLQTCERAKESQEHEIRELQLHNARLANENRRLAADYELLTETLEIQDRELQDLIARLGEASVRAEKLSRAAAAARTLEREVELLEEMQAKLQLQLDEVPQKSSAPPAATAGTELARGLTLHVHHSLTELKAETTLEAPSLTDSTLDDSSEMRPDRSSSASEDMVVFSSTLAPAGQTTQSKPSSAQRRSWLAELAEESFGDNGGSFDPASEIPAHEAVGTLETAFNDAVQAETPADIAGDDTDDALRIPTALDTPEPSALPLLSDTFVEPEFLNPRPTATATPIKPPLRRIHSHESVLSVAASPPRLYDYPHVHMHAQAHMRPAGPGQKLVTPRVASTQSTAPAAVSDLVAHAHSDSREPVSRLSARERLAQVRDIERRPRPERRWVFTPFRSR